MQPGRARPLREEDRPPAPPPRRLHLVQVANDGADPEEESGYAPIHSPDGRRTVRISGQPLPPRRRRSPTATQIQARPDRIALWAVLLGLFLVFMAVATAHAASI